MSLLSKRHLAAALTAAAMLFGGAMVPPAMALTEDEVGTVTRILGELEPEFGKIAYDETVADEWFEQDQENEGRIAKAGFTRESWKEALDATFMGYLATIPESQFEAEMTKIEARLETSSTMNAEQKTAMREIMNEQFAEIRALRESGRDYVDTVRPYADHLHAVFGDPVN
ncbi:hypothetical protein [Aminobacter sp. HY435]|uniref:hypothetical protein n=1 Tax=Aminobacter sp. HY435 TaxID=2970917 RepID=UPI0022B9B4F8|nr:hypothetical protein [Aminobacter sp. HY435]